mgnify:CR=1 FL=1
MPSELTGTAFDFMRMDLPCPKCGKINKEPIRELVANTACRYCGETIDFSREDTRASIAKFAKGARAKKLRRS